MSYHRAVHLHVEDICKRDGGYREVLYNYCENLHLCSFYAVSMKFKYEQHQYFQYKVIKIYWLTMNSVLASDQILYF